MKKVRVILTGAQGTGKTTVLNYFKDTFLTPITEVARNLSKQGVKINEDGDEEGQEIIFKTYVDKLTQNIDYISDRGLTDVIAYTSYLCDKGKIESLNILEEQLGDLETFTFQHPDILIAYFPIEFDLVDDGVRSMDDSFRRSIDYRIKTLLDHFYNGRYITVKGTPEERIKQIISAIDDKLIDDEPKLKMSDIKEKVITV